jgi:hypothetical protein
MPNEILNEFLRPLQHRQPEDRVQFGQGAVPTIRQPNPTFEHEHEDDFDAPCER